MSVNFKIAEVNADNITDHPGVICFINPKNNYYKLKIEWLKEQFLNGLKIKLLYIAGEKSPKGFIEDVRPILKNKKIDFKISELSDFKEAQGAPSHYGVFNLIWNGKILADRYISTTRFENIIRKDV
jgi:hypothetical protein